MLPAIDSALAQLGESVPAEVRAAILELAGKARATIESRATAELINHLRELDSLTEPLAAALLEKAMAR
jgi:hypothetical protein